MKIRSEPMPITRLLYKTIKFDKKKISYGKKRFEVSVADTFWKKSLGLIYRERIQPREGMLFLFDKEGKYDIWMPNMRFSIDILWLDKKSRIIKIVNNAKPCPSMFECKPYESPTNAAYVIELKAGTAKRERMKRGEHFIL